MEFPPIFCQKGGKASPIVTCYQTISVLYSNLNDYAIRMFHSRVGGADGASHLRIIELRSVFP